MNRVWTEEELDVLRRDRAAKVPVPVTAAKLGRPVPATYARARLIGTLVQPHQSWDEASVARLRELVLADPPMTDKRIAAELERSVTQIRWKMQDLGLIGMRDLSKLARITASETSRPKVVKVPSAKPAVRKHPSRPTAAQIVEPVRSAPPVQVVAPVTLEQVLTDLEAGMTERLKSMIAASEAGMIQAARAAIAEKARIDQRLVVRLKRSTEAAARRMAEAERAADAKRIEVQTKRAEAERQQAEAKRKAAERERQANEEKACQQKANLSEAAAKPRAVVKPAVKSSILSAVQGTSQAAPRPTPQPAPAPAPKIVVVETPVAARPAPEPEAEAAQVSGRGGWKSVRRDPARVLAQAKAKAKPANRADAIDLAQAAQAAIERFIAERGVTKTETSGIQSLVSRLQARGYIVVRDENGWTIDQRHRIDSESDLVAFAEARGIAFSAAA